MGYAMMIQEHATLLGFASRNPAHIEAWMRIEHGTRDALSPAQSRDEVLVTIGCVHATAPAETDALAESFGLTPAR